MTSASDSAPQPLSRRELLSRSLAIGTAPIEYTPQEGGIECRYENGTTLPLDFLADPFNDRSPNWNNKVGICPVKSIGTDGWVETGDTGLGRTEANGPRTRPDRDPWA